MFLRGVAEGDRGSVVDRFIEIIVPVCILSEVNTDVIEVELLVASNTEHTVVGGDQLLREGIGIGVIDEVNLHHKVAI